MSDKRKIELKFRTEGESRAYVEGFLSAVNNFIRYLKEESSEQATETMLLISKALKSTIEPKRSHGEWLRKNNSNSWFECSVCKEVSDVVTIMREPTWKFCPNCGASMVKEGDPE